MITNERKIAEWTTIIFSLAKALLDRSPVNLQRRNRTEETRRRTGKSLFAASKLAIL